MAGEPRIVTEGFTGSVDFYLAEDEVIIRDVIVESLQGLLGRRIRKLIWMDTLDEVCAHVGEVGASVWMTDLKLTDGDLVVEEMLEALENRHQRIGWILMSGSFSAEDQIVHNGGDVRIKQLSKPFSLRVLKKVVTNLLDHIEGEEDDDDRDTVQVEQVGAQILERPLSTFGSLAELVRFLPVQAKNVEDDEAAYDLCGLIASEFEELLSLVDSSYEEFKGRWLSCFPMDPELNRRQCLLDLLRDISGAEYVLDVAIHDINNIVAKFNDKGPDPEEWDQTKIEIQALLNKTVTPFASYYENPKLDHVFWEEQDVNEVLEEASRHFDYVTFDVPEGVKVDCPAGALPSILRTFCSNFAKVKRLSGQDDAVSDLFVYMDGDQVVFSVSDNLREFGDDQLPKLFEEGIRSETGAYGMGTGLARTAEIILKSGGQVSSYHLRVAQGVWVQKSPREPLAVVESTALPTTRKGMKKVFEFSLPTVRG